MAIVVSVAFQVNLAGRVSRAIAVLAASPAGVEKVAIAESADSVGGRVKAATVVSVATPAGVGKVAIAE